MKKLVIIGIILAVFVSACERDFPNAQFSVSSNIVQPGETILFTNLSNNAVSFLWDFGDGYTSTQEHPTHYYTDEDDYLVTLTVTSASGKRDVISMTVSAWYTVLIVTVAEWNPAEVIEFIVPDALVILYNTYDDWFYDENAVAYGYTDAAGEVYFPYDAEEQYELLGPYRYWVYVEKTYDDSDQIMYDNYDFRDWPEYLETQSLLAFELNDFLAWADYFPPKKSADSRLEKYPKIKIKDEDNTLIRRRTK